MIRSRLSLFQEFLQMHWERFEDILILMAVGAVVWVGLAVALIGIFRAW